MSVPAQRDPNGRWLPGFAPNPSGRPAAVREVRDLARQHTALAIERLVELMRSGNDATALAAIDQLLNRGWGKPVQAADVEVRKFDMAKLWAEAAKLANAEEATKLVEVTPEPPAPSSQEEAVAVERARQCDEE
jgi:hypothetical protein